MAIDQQRQIIAVAPDQAERKRNDHRLFVGLPRRRRQHLNKVEPQAAGSGIVSQRHFDFRRTGLRIPAHELAHVAAANVGKTLHELLDRRRLTVVSGEVEIHAGTEVLRAEQRLDHAHDLGAFLVDGRGVEIVDLVIERRPYRMR